MYWIVGFVVTLFLFQLVQIVYVVTQAVVGSRVGATVGSISAGWGPTIWSSHWSGINFELRLIPINAYIKFASGDGGKQDDDNEALSDVMTSPTAGKSFVDLPILSRMLIVISGPLSSLMIGAVCISLPVWITAPQVVVNSQLPSVWTPSGVPGLTVNTDVSTYGGQIKLFRQTFLEFFHTAVIRKPLKGWGGYFAWISTCSSAALYSIAAWFSCFGAVIVGLGILNLLPIPPLNGGQLLFLSAEGMFGRLPENVLVTINMLGLLVWFLIFALICFADLNWLFLSFLAGK